MKLSRTVSAESSPVPTSVQRLGLCLFGLGVASAVLLQAMTAFGGPLTLDEHVSYWTIDSEVASSTLRRSLDVTAVPPLSAWLQKAALAVLGKSEFAFRLPSLICAVLSVVVIGLCGRDLGHGNWLVGGTAALITAWHANVLLQTRVGRCYGLVLLISVALVWASWRWSEKLDDWRRAIAWVLLATALVWTHYAAGLLVAVTGVTTVVAAIVAESDAARRRRQLSAAMLTAAALVVSCWPLVTPMFRLEIVAEALNNMEQRYSLAELLGPVLVFGLPITAMACWFAPTRYLRTLPTTKRDFALLACWSALPLLIVWLMTRGENGAFGSPRYRIPFIPGGVLLLSLLLARCRPLLAVGVTVLTIGSFWFSATHAPWTPVRLADQPDVDWRELTTVLENESHEGEAIFVQGGLAEGHLLQFLFEDRLFSEYVACRVSRFYLDQHHPRIGLPYLWDRVPQMRQWYLEELKRQSDKGPIWVIAAVDTDLNRNSLNGFLDVASEAGLETDTVKTTDSAILVVLKQQTVAAP